MRLDARRLGARTASFGSPLGASVRRSRALFGSLEWVQLWIMGPRAGKTSCVGVRQILETDGPVLATSNKRDIVDLTRGPRCEVGAVWVNDLQGLVGEEPTWWWNPLSYVVDVAHADQLAGLFAAATRESGARADAYFDGAGAGAGKNLLSALLLAAAVAGEPIHTVYSWLSTPDGFEPVEHLRAAGHHLPAQALEGAIRLTPNQRDGVFGTALEMASFLRNTQLLPWVTPLGPGDSRPQFDPAGFVRSRQALYLISREGRGSARALTAALTVAVVEAGEDLAATQPRGRLAVPLTCVLDEAANICRWPELPDLYSHYGSRGIIVSTFLQSWSQGVQVWGREGMDKLWSAANIRGVGSGVGEPEFLDRISRLVGDHDVLTRDQSRSRGGRSVSTRNRRERILETADLAALPRGRAVVFVSGLPPVLLKLVHWSDTPYAQNVQDSEEHYGSLAPGRSRERPGLGRRAQQRRRPRHPGQALLRQRRRVRPDVPPAELAPQTTQRLLVLPLVGTRRSDQPPRSAVGVLGEAPARTRHRHGHLVARLRRPPHGRPDRPRHRPLHQMRLHQERPRDTADLASEQPPAGLFRDANQEQTH